MMTFKKLYESIENSDSDDKDLMLTRVKLEVRTWFLRASLAVNIGLSTGFIVWFVTRYV